MQTLYERAASLKQGIIADWGDLGESLGKRPQSKQDESNTEGREAAKNAGQKSVNTARSSE